MIASKRSCSKWLSLFSVYADSKYIHVLWEALLKQNEWMPTQLKGMWCGAMWCGREPCF